MTEITVAEQRHRVDTTTPMTALDPASVLTTPGIGGRRNKVRALSEDGRWLYRRLSIETWEVTDLMRPERDRRRFQSLSAAQRWTHTEHVEGTPEDGAVEDKVWTVLSAAGVRARTVSTRTLSPERHTTLVRGVDVQAAQAAITAPTTGFKPGGHVTVRPVERLGLLLVISEASR